MKKKNKVRLWLRRLHRDAGYFVVGITLVYALSGIFLHHKMAVKTTVGEIDFTDSLTQEDLAAKWEVKTDQPSITYSDERTTVIHFYFPGGMGEYNKLTGLATYETFRDRPVMKFMSQLHENQVKGWGYVADSYAVILIFLAISGLFIVPGKNGFLQRGIWWFSAGVLVVLLFAFIY
ncbi:PepSY-associated TM helix domain-containing protein [Marinilabiliaceae bacterium ANBcel2]|nr:PepSY-associated TM helix domain-containing protein [Marinilabiliaceae bacterium ANBcel2]